MKILTFIIPAYNSAVYLDKCISSMLVPEVLEKLEIIIVNDGSTDATEEIAQSYCSRFPDTVCLICQENRGHGGALNTGCAAARGKYLKVIDADDWAETQNLPEFLMLLENCDSDVVLTPHKTIDICTGEVKKWRSYPEAFGKNNSFGKILADWKGFDRSLTFHGITYRTAFYQEYGIQLSEHVFYEDHEFATFPCCHARGVTCFDLFLYNYRIGDVNQSVSDTNQLRRIGHVETVLRRMTEEYGKLPDSNGKQYAALKIQGLLLSYLTTALLLNPDRKEGRLLAERVMEACYSEVPEVYGQVRGKYAVFYLMNCLHIHKKTWDWVLSSRVYNRLRKKHAFE